MPGLLLYLGLGLVLGSTLKPFDFGNPQLATLLGYSALVVILAEGGLTTRASALRSVLWPSLVLASIGVAVSIAVVALPLVWLMGLDARTAVLLCAVLSATDAAAVFSVLRRLRLAPRLSAVLEAEAGFNDAPVVVLVALLSFGSFEGTPWWVIPLLVLAELAGGAAVGVALGLASRWLLPRLALPAVGLYPISVMALLVGSRRPGACRSRRRSPSSPASPWRPSLARYRRWSPWPPSGSLAGRPSSWHSRASAGRYRSCSPRSLSAPPSTGPTPSSTRRCSWCWS